MTKDEALQKALDALKDAPECLLYSPAQSFADGYRIWFATQREKAIEAINAASQD